MSGVIGALKLAVPERIKGRLLARFSPRTDSQLESWRGKKKVVVTLAGFYQNLGDMALTYAQERIIREALPDYGVLLFPSSDTYSKMRALQSVVGPGDIITTIGGGNMDDRYASLEDARRFVVESFPSNAIVAFPQTMSFSETRKGRRALRRGARTYRSHSRLVMFARERTSWRAMRSALKGVELGCVPDSVLSLRLDPTSSSRDGVLVSIRQDQEAALESSQRAAVDRIVRSVSSDVLYRDTVDVALEDCMPDTYEATLRAYWALMGSRRLVVTDRLHTMIFSVLTGTPAVVLSNSNHKIRGTYEDWLSELPRTRLQFIDRFDEQEVARAVSELWAETTSELPSLDLDHGPLRNALKMAARAR